MNDLVQRLASGEHKITVGGPQPSLKSFKDAVGRKYVHIKFPETRGGTDLGVKLDEAACKLDGANLDSGDGTVHLEGTLTLDYVPVRCIADLDLTTLEGRGKLQIIAASVESTPA